MIKENLIGLFKKSIIQNWYGPAFSNYGGETVTFKEVAENIFRWHLFFQKSGIKRGDKIALIGMNSINWTQVYLATITYGAVIVPILPDFSVKDMEHLINHSDSRLLFAENRIIENLNTAKLKNLDGVLSLQDLQVQNFQKKNLQKNISTVEKIFIEKFPGGFKQEDCTLPVVDNSALSSIVYTSGTTGFSKGVMLPLQSLTVNVVYAIHHFELHNGDNMLSILPLAHAFGCAFEFLFPFCLGVHTTFLNKTPSPKILLKALADVRPKLFLTVPLIIEKIYKSQLKPLLEKRVIKWVGKLPKVNDLIGSQIRKKLLIVFGGRLVETVVGGSGLNGEVELFFKSIKFPITTGYGMTECGPLISYSGWKEHKSKSVGQIIDYLEVRIDSEDPYKVDGEILVRGENVMTGYYKNEEASKAAIDAEGWLHTGDMGVIDKENTIFIHGRKKNMILGPSGQNIYPEEIEAKIDNMPFVQESLVLEKDGKIFALVYPDYEMADTRGVPVENLEALLEENRRKVNETLPKFSQIVKIKLYPKEFEKTPTKKVKRFLYEI